MKDLKSNLPTSQKAQPHKATRGRCRSVHMRPAQAMNSGVFDLLGTERPTPGTNGPVTVDGSPPHSRDAPTENRRKTAEHFTLILNDDRLRSQQGIQKVV